MRRLDEIDVEHLNGWIGDTGTADAMGTQGLVERYSATIGDWPAECVEGVPLGRHWYFASLRAGDAVSRRSRIASITPKKGRCGSLASVAEEHEHRAGDTLAMRERKDVVCRPANPRTPAAAPATQPPEGAFIGDSVTLFLYSAMTFNGHRSHYDHPYATQEEGYADLVLTAPLNATLLIHAAARAAGTQRLHVAYPGLSPLVVDEAVTIEPPKDDVVQLEKTGGTVIFQVRFAGMDT